MAASAEMLLPGHTGVPGVPRDPGIPVLGFLGRFRPGSGGRVYFYFVFWALNAAFRSAVFFRWWIGLGKLNRDVRLVTFRVRPGPGPVSGRFGTDRAAALARLGFRPVGNSRTHAYKNNTPRTTFPPFSACNISLTLELKGSFGVARERFMKHKVSASEIMAGQTNNNNHVDPSAHLSPSPPPPPPPPPPSLILILTL